MVPSVGSLKKSKLLQNAYPRIKSFLDGFSPYRKGPNTKDHDNFFPILSKRHIKGSIDVIQKLNAQRFPDVNHPRRIVPSRDILENGMFRKHAAVLIPIIDIGNIKGPSILFTMRSSSVGTHACEISFPGGHVDDKKDNGCLVTTAIRESREELLLNNNSPTTALDEQYDLERDVQICGRLSTIPSVSGVMVTPFLGIFSKQFPTEESVTSVFPGNRDEVETVFTIPIHELLENETSEPLKRWNGHHGPVFPVHIHSDKLEKEKIWGLTAIILRPVLHTILKPIFLMNN